MAIPNAGTGSDMGNNNMRRIGGIAALLALAAMAAPAQAQFGGLIGRVANSPEKSSAMLASDDNDFLYSHGRQPQAADRRDVPPEGGEIG